MYNVIIAGSRDFQNYNVLRSVCDSVLHGKRRIRIISGGARGADRLGELYARERGYQVEVIRADWDNNGKSAGYIRNAKMLEKADCLVAFWDGKSHGTKHMIDISVKKGITVFVASPDADTETHISRQWDSVLDREAIADVLGAVNCERLKATIYPEKRDVLNAFKYTDFNDVKVVIIGQDPYPGTDSNGTPHAHGLAFSSMSDQIPSSLKNIFKEIESETGIRNNSADLTAWTDSGVLLLNRVLTVEAGLPNSHIDIGWEQITQRAVELISQRETPTVYMLWGKRAQQLESAIKTSRYNFILKCGHPSPLSATRFFGCGHFIRANKFLRRHGIQEVDWRV